MEPIKVILNPAAGRGYGAQAEPKVRQCLEAQGVDFEIVRTNGPWHAAELAQHAAEDGFTTVVGAGGDGTANEVINGLMAASLNGATPRMGVIPAGSGSDFASGIGLPLDLQEACHHIARQNVKTIDLGRVTVPGQEPRYFGNVVGIGFDGAVLIQTLSMKRLRGLPLYLLAVLKTILVDFQAPRMTIEYDGQRMELPATLVSVANGPREGGGFVVAPDARPDDGLFDLCIARKVSRLTMLRLLPHFLRGTHTDLDQVTMAQGTDVTVSSPDGLVAHVDGEVLCTDAPEIRCEILPGALDVYS
jgi:YegS/Rv2252/BmrU family lipid kinase